LFGRIHAINNQGDIHGWQRVTIMKFFETKTGEYDPKNVWAYEGVVLPGGHMIIGRWSDALANHADRHNSQSGPFIFWNVEKSGLDTPIKQEEALEFAKNIDDPNLCPNF
jgi:hypothetical protein